LYSNEILRNYFIINLKKGDTHGNIKCRNNCSTQSGGPKMTCTGNKNPGNNYICCQWFSGSKLESGFFPPSSLIIPPEKDEKKKNE